MKTEHGHDTRNSLPDINGILGLIALLALATSWLYFLHSQSFYEPDSVTYVVPASNILTGRGYVNSEGYPETNRTPGYPLLILAFLWAHLDLRYLIIFQHLLRVLIAVATSAFTFQVTGNRRTAILAGILLCLDLPLLESSNSLLTELLFAAIFTIVLWQLWTESGQREKPGIQCFAAGLLAGASALVRPVAVFFFLPAALYLFLVRKSFGLRAGLSFSLAFLCLPATWAARNYYETGFFTVSSISGINMLLYRAAGALAISDPGDFGANLQKRQTQLQMQACEDITSLSGRDCSQATIPQKAHYYSRFGRSIILAHPLAYAKLALRGDAVMIFGGSLVRFREMTHTSPRAAVIFLLIYTIPLFCLAIMGLFVLWKTNRELFALIFLASFYFLVISGGAETDSRFRVPIIGIYCMAAATGLDATLKRRTAKNRLARMAAVDTLQV